MVKSDAKKLKRKAKKLAKKAKAAKAVSKILPKLEGKGTYNGLRARLRGRGDFVDDLVGGGARLLGNGIRSGVSWLTDKAGGLLKNLLGSGDYLTSNSPVANAHVMGAMPTMVGTKNDSAFVIEFVEEIAGITATDVFKSTVFHLNPGLSSTFAWLPGVARKFEQYELEAMVVVYKPTITPLNDAASGDLVINVVYDANGNVPQTITTALNSYLAVGGRPLDQMMAAVECAPKETPTRVKFVRAAETGEDEDHNLYDWGKLCISQEGQPTATVGQAIGRLYLSYKFRFYKPLVQFDSLDVPTAHYYITNCAFATPLGGSASDWIRKSDNTLELTRIDSDSFAFPSYVQEGKWLVMWYCVSSSAALTTPSITGVGWTAVAVWNNGTIPSASSLASAPSGGATAARGLVGLVVSVTGAGPIFNFASAAGFSGLGDVIVCPLDVDLVALHARRLSSQRRRAQERSRIELIREDHRGIEDLRRQLKELRDRMYPPEDLYEEKEDCGGLLPPSRARNRAAKVESDEESYPSPRASVKGLRLKHEVGGNLTSSQGMVVSQVDYEPLRAKSQPR